MRNPVTTWKRKYDGSSKGPWHGDLVDAVGARWLVVYYERPAHEAGEPPAPVEHALRYFGMDCPLSVLVSFDALGGLIEFQCDAGLAATISGRELEFTDLDLDLIVRPGEEPFVRDETDFERRAAEMGYPDAVVESAHRGIELAGRLYVSQACPFDGSPARVLGAVLASRGPL